MQTAQNMNRAFEVSDAAIQGKRTKTYPAYLALPFIISHSTPCTSPKRQVPWHPGYAVKAVF
eukprot:937329-Prorocentrum_minimum.AAC.1